MVWFFSRPGTGGSMNPVRTIGPAFTSGNFRQVWIYLLAPIVGGILGAGAYSLVKLRNEETDVQPCQRIFSGQLLPWRPRRCQLCAIEASGYSLHSLSNIGVEAAVSKHWGEKRTKPKHWGFPNYYPFLNLYLIRIR